MECNSSTKLGNRLALHIWRLVPLCVMWCVRKVRLLVIRVLGVVYSLWFFPNPI
jgi:hypothetical protein